MRRLLGKSGEFSSESKKKEFSGKTQAIFGEKLKICRILEKSGENRSDNPIYRFQGKLGWFSVRNKMFRFLRKPVRFSVRNLNMQILGVRLGICLVKFLRRVEFG